MLQMNNLSVRFRNLSFIATMLVIAIHTNFSDEVGSAGWWLNGCIRKGLALAAVPYFFLASGYFAAEGYHLQGYWKGALKRRVKTLMIPFFCWSALFAFELWALQFVQGLMHGEVLSIMQLAKSHSFGEWSGLNLFVMPALFPLWFVRCLFLFFIGLPLFKVASSRNSVFVLTMIGLVAALVWSHQCSDKWAYFWDQGVSLHGAIYFLLGSYVRQHKQVLNILRHRAPCIFCGILAMVYWVLKVWAQLQGICLAVEFSYLAIFCTIIWLFATIPDTPIPNWLAQSSFGCFLIHVFIVSVLNVLVVWIGRWCHCVIADYAVTSLGLWLMTAISSVVIVNVFCRIWPNAAEGLFGGRVVRYDRGR